MQAVLPSTVKVKPKTFSSIKTADWLKSEADLAACLGERESFQILLYDKSKPIKNLKWSVQGLKNSDIKVSVIPVGYVKQPQNPTNLDTYGFLPDPLLDYMDTLTVQPGDVQTLWVRFKISRNCKPGDYSGKVELFSEGNDTGVIPFKLKVWDIAMPKMPFLPLVTGQNPYPEFAMKYGFNPGAVQNTRLLDSLKMNKEQPLRKLKRWKKLGATAINLGYTFEGRFGMTAKHPLPDEKELNAWLDELEEDYKLVIDAGLKDQCFINMYSNEGHELRPGMKVVTDALRKRFPELRQTTTAHSNGKKGQAYDFGLEDNLTIDTWILNVMQFRDPEIVAIGKAKGRDIWWYTHCNPRPDFPAIYVDNLGMESRMLFGLLPHSYGITGYMYYGLMLRGKRSKPLQGGPFLDWEFPRSFGHKTICYKSKNEKPIASIRLENIKDGLEDYNLIAIAKAYQQALHKAGKKLDLPATKLIPELFKVPNPYVENILNYCRDPQKLETLRRELADYIIRAKAALGRDII